LFLLLALLCGGCELINRFDAKQSVENTEIRCADGIDNDGNGFSDCQEFTCLSFPSCCDRPGVVIDSTFASPSCSSDAIDPGLWHLWGYPLPQLCPDGWTTNKQEQCFDVGMVGAPTIALKPGLHIRSSFSGLPEIGGRFEIGLTLEDQIPSPPSGATCGPYTGAAPIFSLRLVRAAGDTPSLQAAARISGVDVAFSPLLAPGDHAIDLAVLPDASLSFCVDGESWCYIAHGVASATDDAFHLVLQGRGSALRVHDVRVTTGRQCETPGDWTPSVKAPFFTGTPGKWDSSLVSDPAVILFNGATRIHYRGCVDAPEPDTCSGAQGTGLIESSNGWATSDKPLFVFLRSFSPNLGVLRPAPADGSLPVLFSVYPLEIGSRTSIFPDPPPYQNDNGLPPVLSPGASGEWDELGVCCPSAVTGPDGVIRLYYSSLSAPGKPSRVGLALSHDGGLTFERWPQNPVLSEGSPGTFDSGGVADPDVTWDEQRKVYRMWYGAQSFPTGTSIGYAISADGIEWTRYPGNPVISAGAEGFQEVGGPTVLWRYDDATARLWLHARRPGDTALQLYEFDQLGTPSP
jgi:hypothetical protein